MDIANIAPGAYYASFPVISKIDAAQSLGLNPTLFTKDGGPEQSNLFGDMLQSLHGGITRTYDDESN